MCRPEAAQADGFFPSPRPFMDFCLYRHKKRGSELEAAFKAIKLFTERADGFSYAGSGPLKPRLFSGWGRIGGRFYIGAHAEKFTLQEALYGAGNYACCLIDRSGAAGCADFFGLGALFAYQDKRGFAISNRAHLAALAAFFFSSRKLNIPHIKAMALTGSFFENHPLFDDSPILGLQRLSRRQWFKLEGGGLFLREREGLKSGLSYEALLAAAGEEARENLAALKAGGSGVFFSLGADLASRLAIAPFIQEKAVIRAPEREADQAACARIMAVFPNLELEAGFEEKLRPASPAEALGAWRSYNFGFCHKLEVPETIPREPGAAVIAGGPAELFGGGADFFLPGASGVIKAWLGRALDGEGPLWHKLYRADRAALEERLTRAMRADVSGGSEKERIRAFFQGAFARGKGARQIFRCWAGGLELNPALSASLYKAYELRGEAALHDFIRAQSGGLAEIPCDRPYPGQEIKSLSPAGEGRRREASAGLKEAAKRRKAASLRLLAAEGQRPFEDFLREEVMAAARRAAARELGIRPLMQRLTQLFLEGGSYSLASKILSLDDFLFPLASLKEAAPRVKEALPPPVAGAVLGQDSVEIRLAPGAEAGELSFALNLRSGSKIIKAFAWQDAPLFETKAFAGLYDNADLLVKSRAGGRIQSLRSWL